MSRHELRTRDGRNEAVVGWDVPMQTFFAQIANGKLEDIGEMNPPLLWVGADRVREIESVPDLYELVVDYVHFDSALIRDLLADQRNGRQAAVNLPDWGL